jgi:hypothetical protein
MKMSCEARAQLLDELSSAVRAYTRAVNRMIRHSGLHPPATRVEVVQAREECDACRSALLAHERDHGCVSSLVAL